RVRLSCFFTGGVSARPCGKDLGPDTAYLHGKSSCLLSVRLRASIAPRRPSPAVAVTTSSVFGRSKPLTRCQVWWKDVELASDSPWPFPCPTAQVFTTYEAGRYFFSFVT